MYKFVLWGYGQRGKRFLELCPNEHIVAIIDQNYEKQKENHGNVPIISYETYKQDYRQCDLLVTVIESEDIQNQLENDAIYNYHLLRDCPPELIGYYGKKWLNDLPIKIDAKKRYVIYGLNVYALLLREYLMKTYGFEELEIVSDIEDEQRNESFQKQYEFIRKGKRFQIDEEILHACKEVPEEITFAQNEMQEVFDFFGKIAEYNALGLAVYKDRYVGEACFIIATGPSLRLSDLEILRKNHCKCIAVNKIYLLFDKIKWRPDIYVAVDDKIIQSSMEEIKKMNIGLKIVAGQNGVYGNGIESIHCHKLFCKGYPKFSEDITKGVYNGLSVLYDSIQIAVYMGFKTLYILGADHNYTSNQSDSSNHFHKDYYKGIQNPNKYIKEDVECAFQAARQYAESHGIKIYNATRGGKLEVFERVDFDSLFPQN